MSGFFKTAYLLIKPAYIVELLGLANQNRRHLIKFEFICLSVVYLANLTISHPPLCKL